MFHRKWHIENIPSRVPSRDWRIKNVTLNVLRQKCYNENVASKTFHKKMSREKWHIKNVT